MSSLNRHVKRCNKQHENGFRIKHIAGHFNAHVGGYVSIEKEGIALDKTICKQEPILDEYDQQPEHYFEAPSIEDLPLNAAKKRKLIEIESEEANSEESDEICNSDWAQGKTVILCPHDWCTQNYIGKPQLMLQHIRKCKEQFKQGKRLNHFPGQFKAHSGKYVSIKDNGLALDKTICKVEPTEESLVENITLISSNTVHETADKSIQCDLLPTSAVIENQTISAQYAELFDTYETKINIMLQIFGSYDKVFEKLQHRINKK